MASDSETESAYMRGKLFVGRRLIGAILDEIADVLPDAEPARCAMSLAETKAAILLLAESQGIELPEDAHPADMVRAIMRELEERDDEYPDSRPYCD